MPLFLYHVGWDRTIKERIESLRVDRVIGKVAGEMERERGVSRAAGVPVWYVVAKNGGREDTKAFNLKNEGPICKYPIMCFSIIHLTFY